MLNEDDAPTATFLDSDTSRYFLGTGSSSALNRSISMPLYTAPLGVEANPWNLDTQFGDFSDSHQDLNNSTLENDIDSNITAASVLVDAELPEIYHTAYVRARPVNERVSLESLQKVIALAELSPSITQEIVNMVLPENALYVTHNEFNTALALVACAQKNMEISLYNVYIHRNDLPSPILLNLDQLNLKQSKLHVDDIKDQVVDDPWSVMAIPNIVEVGTDRTGKLDTMANRPSTLRPKLSLNGHSGLRSRSVDHTFRTDTQPTSFLSSPMGGRAYSQERIKATEIDRLKLAQTGGMPMFLELDAIRVEAVPEKQGFIFKHVNYTVQSQIRSAKVTRRYSDFYWFWEILLKRYPMRVIPNLPPKKMGTKDDVFMENRCKGLARFINSVVRHPVLGRDEILDIFLTEPTEFLTWRRNNQPDIDEEFVRLVPNVADLQATIPDDLDNRLANIKAKLADLIAQYGNLCATMDKIVEQNRAQSQAFARYSETLRTLGELENQCYVRDCLSCPLIVRGYCAVAQRMQDTGNLLNQQSLGVADGILEQLKRHRDLLVSFQEMLDRRDRMALVQIDSMSKKIASNKAKTHQNRGAPDPETQVETVDNTVEADQSKMMLQEQRDIHIRYCLASELSYIHKQQAYISLMYQKYVQDQLKCTRQLTDNWKKLQDSACEMPLDPDDFA